MIVEDPGRRSAEFAIGVADPERRRGIGTRLMRSLTHVTRRHGLEMFEGEVHADNRPMPCLVEALGFDAVRSSNDHRLVKMTRSL